MWRRQGDIRCFPTAIPVAGRHLIQWTAVFVVWGALQWGPKRHFWACMAENAFAQSGFAIIPGYIHPRNPYRGARQSVLHLGGHAVSRRTSVLLFSVQMTSEDVLTFQHRSHLWRISPFLLFLPGDSMCVRESNVPPMESCGGQTSGRI